LAGSVAVAAAERERSVGLVWFVAVCTRNERQDLDVVVIAVEEEGGGEAQWR
jgi:hypothetical protein